MAIYVKFAEEDKPKNVREFIKKFYLIPNFGYLIAQSTYSDKELKKLQCVKNVRSFDDLEELIKTYYPTVKTSKIFEYLLTTDYKTKEKSYHPYLGYCGDMKKIRFIPSSSIGYNAITQKGENSKYTWKELLSQLNINNFQEFKEYVKKRK